MAPVDPRHFFIMLRSATQFYADFGMLAADVLGRPTANEDGLRRRG